MEKCARDWNLKIMPPTIHFVKCVNLFLEYDVDLILTFYKLSERENGGFWE
jgi:hypothetical protein